MSTQMTSGVEGRHGVERFGASRKRGHLIALTSKEVAQQLPHMRLIVDDHDTARSYTSGHASWPQVVEVMERINGARIFATGSAAGGIPKTFSIRLRFTIRTRRRRPVTGRTTRTR
jgi:hypothetical protein